METFPLNEIIVSILNHWANSSLYISNSIVFCGVYLGWMIIISLLVYIYRARHRLSALRFVLISVISALGALFVANIIKSVYPVARPAHTMAGIVQVFTPGDKFSFPSSHVAFFGGLAFAILRRYRRWGWYLLAGTILIGIARIAAGIHYPLDILAGLLLAWLFFLVFSRWLS